MSAPPRARDSQPVARVCLLGASNLTRGFGTAVRVARGGLGGPLELHAALGRGRSFGGPSSFLGRTLPGIAQCGLWLDLEAARAARPLPTYALLCDMGNDVAFGVPGPQLLDCIEQTLERLDTARSIVVGPPLESVRAVSNRAFRFWGRVFFPARGLQRGALMATLEEVDAGLRQLCRVRGLTFVEPHSSWYGVDPIHVRHGAQELAWRTILEAWGPVSDPLPPGRVPLPAPLERRILGVSFRRAQPAAELGDGTTVSIY